MNKELGGIRSLFKDDAIGSDRTKIVVDDFEGLRSSVALKALIYIYISFREKKKKGTLLVSLELQSYSSINQISLIPW